VTTTPDAITRYFAASERGDIDGIVDLTNRFRLETVTITEPKGSFAMPAGAAWLILVGDLTAMPAMARITTSVSVPTYIWAEVPDDLSDYLPEIAPQASKSTVTASLTG
jgi:hypothetical protein